MKALIFSFTAAGTALGLVLRDYLCAHGVETDNETMAKFVSLDTRLRPIQLNLQESVRQAFRAVDAIIFIGAAAIAVRSVAPYLRNKETDPAVIVIDEKGQFVIPLLAGHIGGANGLARMLADAIGGQAVITTATDVNDLFAVDEWATQYGMHMSSLSDAKQFAAQLIERGQAGLYSEFPIGDDIPHSLVKGNKGPLGLAITIHDNCRPFGMTMAVYPTILHLGIGCKRDTDEATISRRVSEDMERLHLSWNAVADISTIDIKRDEIGLTQFAAHHQMPIHYYTARQLNDAPGKFISSDFVRRIVGTDNVCERAATLASRGGTLLLQKSGNDGVTVAIACENYTVGFTRKR